MLSFRFADINDLELYYDWANDPLVRQNSLNTEKIDFPNHAKWFTNKINDPNTFMYVFIDDDNNPVGQVIIEKMASWVSVGQSVAKEHRGKKYSAEMLSKSTDDFLSKFPKETIISVVKASNAASIKMAEKSGFNVLLTQISQGLILVLKGFKQNDEQLIVEAKIFYNV
jgi:RimJ/RimL family protein N-acetyltransferase